MKVNVLHNN